VELKKNRFGYLILFLWDKTRVVWEGEIERRNVGRWWMQKEGTPGGGGGVMRYKAALTCLPPPFPLHQPPPPHTHPLSLSLKKQVNKEHTDLQMDVEYLSCLPYLLTTPSSLNHPSPPSLPFPPAKQSHSLPFHLIYTDLIYTPWRRSIRTAHLPSHYIINIIRFYVWLKFIERPKQKIVRNQRIYGINVLFHLLISFFKLLFSFCETLPCNTYFLSHCFNLINW
jgi:hypothetical protein